MDKEKRMAEKHTAQKRREDAELVRVLVWFGAAVVAELVLLLLNRYYVSPHTGVEMDFQIALYTHFPLVIGVLAVLFAASVVWLLAGWKKRASHILPGAAAGIVLALLVIAVVTYTFFGSGVRLLCGLVPAVAVLALVYYLYQKEFFASTLLSALGILGLWLIRRADGRYPVLVYGYVAVVVVLLLAALAVGRTMQRNGGALKLGDKRRQIFSRSASYVPLYVTCALVAVCIAGGLIGGISAAYYLMFVLVAWLFAMAVYYTVKQM